MARTVGARGKRTIASEKNVEWWAKQGKMTPLEHMLNVQHGEINGPHASIGFRCPHCQEEITAPDLQAADQYRAAVDAAPYIHAKLSAAKIDADVTNHPTKEQASEAADLVKEQIKGNGHTNGTNGAAVVVNGASTSEG